MIEDSFIGERQVQSLTSLSKTTRWRMERAGVFPRRRKLSVRRVGWLRSEILAWIEERAEAA